MGGVSTLSVSCLETLGFHVPSESLVDAAAGTSRELGRARRAFASCDENEDQNESETAQTWAW